MFIGRNATEADKASRLRITPLPSIGHPHAESSIRRVLVEILLPDGPPIEAIGRVAWSKRVLTPRERDQEAGIGVEFLGGAAEQFNALEHYIDKLRDA